MQQQEPRAAVGTHKHTHTHTHTHDTPYVVVGGGGDVVVVVVVVFPNMAMAAQEKGQEEEEEEEENQTKSNATHCTTRYRTHVSPPKSYQQSTKIERKKQTNTNFLQHTTYSTHPNPELKSQMGNHTKHANRAVCKLNVSLKPPAYGLVNRPNVNDYSPFQ